MNTLLTEDWQRELHRQNLRLNLDRTPRIVLAVLALALSGLFVDPFFTALIIAFFLITEAAEPLVMRNFARDPSRLRRNLYIVVSVLGMADYCATVVLLWLSPDFALKIAAIVYLGGGFVNVLAVNTIYMPLAVGKLIPLVMASAFLPGEYASRLGVTPGIMLVFASTALLLIYISRVIYDTHRAGRESEATRQKAEDLSQVKSRFLEQISHEMRNPLNAIRGASQIIGQSAPPPSPDQNRAAMAMLDESTLALQGIIDDAMAAAEHIGGGWGSNVTVGPLRQVVGMALDRLRAQAAGAGLAVDVATTGQMPQTALFDAVALRKSVGELGKVALSLAKDCATAVQVQVCANPADLADVADGMLLLEIAVLAPVSLPPQAITHGLEAARKAAADLHANLLVTPTAPHGTRIALQVWVRRAGSAGPQVPTVPASAQAGLGTPKNILVVDDVSTNRFIVAHLLRAEGMQVAEADSGEQALVKLQNQPFDLVLMDMNMPQMSGAETFRAIRASGAQWAKVPVIALTANALSEQRATYGALGLSGFIPKPVDRSAMLAEIGRALLHR